MIHKRSHLKSRNGCLECKKRRVKCDESPNSCGACIKRGTRCSFKPSTPPPPSPRLQPVTSGSIGNLLDLELLHNFSTKTCLSMTTYVPLQRFYENEFISEALKCDYLLHLLLGISAFHLVQQHQELLESASEQQMPSIRTKMEGYLIAAHVHHNAGLSSFRQNLANITSENCHALFACSSLIVMTSFAVSCDSLRPITNPSHTTQDSSPGVTEWLVLLRGVKTVIIGSKEWVRSGPMAPILSIPDNGGRSEGYECNLGKVDEDVALYLNRLSVFIMGNSAPRVSEICIAAIELLRKSFAGMAYGCDPSVVFFWPVLVDQDFMTLLELKNPEALLIMGAYCVLLHTQNWSWWIRGWPANMLRTIESMLDEPWRAWLWWPLHITSTEDAGKRMEHVLMVIEGVCCQ